MAAVGRVELVAVDEIVLAQLVQAATTDAAADEVTPPLTDGPHWTPARIAWLQQFHRSHRSGRAGQAVWAVLVDGAVAGQVRLQPGPDDDTAEIGLWLCRSVRNRGVGTFVVRAVVARAAAAGFGVVVAQTSTTNAGARRILQRAGFTLSPGGDRGLRARLVLPVDLTSPAAHR